MPLTKRAVSPVLVSVHRLPPSVQREELECVANGTLANLVRQLSSLSRHAEHLFGELYHEAVKLDHKTNTLATRVDRLTHKVTLLDSNDDEVLLQDLHLRKAFKSAALIDQHSLDRSTLPTALNECLANCDPPPELDKLNPYRDDKRTALRYYTDPSYFFDLWKQEMLKDLDAASKRPKNPKARSPTDGSSQGRKKKARQSNDPRNKYLEKTMRAGEMIDLPAEYQAPELLRRQQATMVNNNHVPPPGMIRTATNGYPNGAVGHPVQAIYDQHHAAQHPRVSVQHGQQYYSAATPGRPVTSQYMDTGYGRSMQRTDANSGHSPGSYRPNQAPPAPPPSETPNGHFQQQFQQLGLQQTTPVRPAPSQPYRDVSPLPPHDDDFDLPPPPPLSPEQRMHTSVLSSTDHLPSPPPMHLVPSGAKMPPPPPPPPPPPSMHHNGLIIGSFGGGGERQRSTSPPKQLKEATGGETMSNLLLEIREGIKLKKVQRHEERAEERAATEGNDVAAILKRRMEHVMGGSDSNSDDEEGDEDDWDDD